MFYVYEHIRNDTLKPFYIGKGNGKRAFSKRDRTAYWQNVVNKADGFTVQYLAQDVDEEFAFLLEVEAIDAYRKRGITLVNLTDGGEGITGFKHSDATKRLLSEKQKGKGHPHTPESIEKIRQANTGVVFSSDRKEKIRKKAVGRKMPTHVKERLTERMKLFQHSETTKEHLRQVNIGRKHTPEALIKMSEWQKDNPKLTCPHCNRASSAGNAKRWHFNNCKFKG